MSPLGSRGSIAQTSQTITIAPALSRSRSQGERAYTLDGSETQYGVETAAGDTAGYAARSRWVSTALAITTTALPLAGSKEWESLMTLSLNGDGQLEILMVGPNLWPSETASTHRFVYKKTAQSTPGAR